MTKSFVLQVLKIFGHEEMLKLSQLAPVKVAQMKKAAGAELIVWDDAPEPEEHPDNSRPPKDNVLPFKRFPEATPDPRLAEARASEESQNFQSSDFMLWQRELGRENAVPDKKDAVKGYARATQMYVVKTPTVEGKEKIRFAETNGVLLNKKQA